MPEKGNVLISNIEQNIIKKYVPTNIQLLSFSLFLKRPKLLLSLTPKYFLLTHPRNKYGILILVEQSIQN